MTERKLACITQCMMELCIEKHTIAGIECME